MEIPNEFCPWCESPISRAKFVEIETKIREEEQKRLAEVETAMAARLQEKFRLDLEIQKRAAEKEAKQEAEKRIANITAERECDLHRLKQLEDQEVVLRKQADEEAQKREALVQKHEQDLKLEIEAAAKRANEEAEKRLIEVISERDHNLQKIRELQEMEGSIRKEATEQAQLKAQEETDKRIANIAAERECDLQRLKRLEDQEVVLRKQAEEETQKREALEEKHEQDLKVEIEAAAKRANEEAEKRLIVVVSERDRNLQKVKQLEEREAAIRMEATQEAERKAQKELEQDRLILKQAEDAALLKQQAEFNRDRESWQKKVQDLQRQLEQKTAYQLGDGAELDLFEILRGAFPDDQIIRAQKGQPGADLHQYIKHKGEVCGQIIYDSKNHQAWRDQFVTKLREDQVRANAEYAVLSTTVFPRGKKALCVESDVIVVSPAQAVHVASLLRQALLTMHIRGLSQQERAGKINKLYEYITSSSYSQRFSHVSTLSGELLDIDVQEESAHRKVWKKRGELLVRQRNAFKEIEIEIGAIIEGDVESKSPAA